MRLDVAFTAFCLPKHVLCTGYDILDLYGNARSRRRASSRRGVAPLVYIRFIFERESFFG